jgi:DNA-directed RNA polymerase specialized sigma24 family protein
MLASYDEAEDAVQATYLRAWCYRDTFEGENVCAWLYKIATNGCLDDLRKRGRQPVRSADVPWLSLYPDDRLD